MISHYKVVFQVKIQFMRTLLFFLSLFLFQTVQAQNFDNYEWVGETTTKYTFAHDQKTEFSLPDKDRKSPRDYQKTTLLKFAPPTIECTKYAFNRFFSTAMTRGIKAGRYGTTINGQPVDVERYLQQFAGTVDTLVTFDPETNHETVQLVRRERPLYPGALYITQRWYYDGKTLRSTVVGITPFQQTPQGEMMHGTLQPVLDKQQPDETRLYAGSPLAFRTLRTIDFKRAKTLKGSTDKFLQQYFIEDAKSGQKKLSYNSSGTYCPETTEDFTKDILPGFTEMRIDTVYTFDPETYQETMEIIRNKPYSLENAEHFQATQNWYFDPENGRVEVVLRAIGPAREVTNDEGEFLYQTVDYLILE